MKIQALDKNVLSRVKFKSGSCQAQIFDLLYKQDLSEAEVLKALKLEDKRFQFNLYKVNRKITDYLGTSKTPQSITANVEKVVDEAISIPQSDVYIPRHIGKFTDVKVLEKCYKDKSFVLIMGETGCGKTHLVRHFAKEHNLPYVRINLNGGTTADELIGHWVPKAEGGFRWQDGVLTTFVRNGGIVALDEVNACPAEIIFCLHSLTDDERTLTLTSKDGEVVKAHPDFFLVATMNPDYEGTRPLNAAFKDRFKVKLFFDYDSNVEEKLIADTNLLRVASKLRLMKTKSEVNTPVSTRLLLYFKSNEELFGKPLAIELFLNNFEPYEREAIKNVIEMIYSGKSDKSSQSGTSNGK